LLAPTTVDTADTINELTCVALDNVCYAYFQVTNTYSYSAVRTDLIKKANITISGTVSSVTTSVRSLGLASKAFLVNSNIYMLATEQTAYQPTYFLVDANGSAVARVAYGNGGGYELNGILSQVTVAGTDAATVYLFKDLLLAVNKSQAPASVGGVYTQTGVNLLNLDMARKNLSTAEIGNNLHIAGGFVWAYDGTNLTEQGFNYWPENSAVTTSTSGGNLADQTYFYQITYEWTDAQGNIFRSAPSIPLEQVTSGGNTSTNTLKIPTLRVTYKSKVRIVIYRWSTAQQNYYQITSITSPLLNDPTVDSVTYVDTAADSTIIGNPLIYTTGGVVENLPAPGTSSLSLYQSRLVLITSENKNVVWYSKQVLQGTPVEMSDLFTIYVAPSIGAQGSTGDTEVLYPLDEKLLFFKANAIYYMTGVGPDATGANNDFSEPAFITASVGSSNVNSLCTIPQGVMFQSNKGIWMLGRELSTQYIGSDIETDTLSAVVTSATNIPGTTQARMTLDSGKAVMYDYFFGRWCTFTNLPAISSTLYTSLHTYLTSLSEVRQEQEGYYKDGLSKPVGMTVETPWYNLAGLQGFQRAMQVYLLGTYETPHTIRISVYYDYEDGATQVIDVTPEQIYDYWGDPSPNNSPFWGESSVWGGGQTLEQARIFLNRQKLQAFKMVIQEVFDPTQGTQPGAGLSLSGLNVVVALKKGYTTIKAARSFG